MRLEVGTYVHPAKQPGWPDLHLECQLSREQQDLVEQALIDADRCPDCVWVMEMTECGITFEPSRPMMDAVCRHGGAAWATL